MYANVRYSQDRFLHMNQAMGNLVTILKEKKEKCCSKCWRTAWNILARDVWHGAPDGGGAKELKFWNILGDCELKFGSIQKN